MFVDNKKYGENESTYKIGSESGTFEKIEQEIKQIIEKRMYVVNQPIGITGRF